MTPIQPTTTVAPAHGASVVRALESAAKLETPEAALKLLRVACALEDVQTIIDTVSPTIRASMAAEGFDLGDPTIRSKLLTSVTDMLSMLDGTKTEVSPTEVHFKSVGGMMGYSNPAVRFERVEGKWYWGG